jgi:hypothetical protein
MSCPKDAVVRSKVTSARGRHGCQLGMPGSRRQATPSWGQSQSRRRRPSVYLPNAEPVRAVYEHGLHAVVCQESETPVCAGVCVVGGTGLEPVTPSLSTRSGVRVRSPGFAHGALLSGTSKRANASANPSERRALPLLPRRGRLTDRTRYARPSMRKSSPTCSALAFLHLTPARKHRRKRLLRGHPSASLCACDLVADRYALCLVGGLTHPVTELAVKLS